MVEAFFVFRVIPTGCELMLDSPLQSESLEDKKSSELDRLTTITTVSRSRRVLTFFRLVKTPPWGGLMLVVSLRAVLGQGKA